MLHPNLIACKRRYLALKNKNRRTENCYIVPIDNRTVPQLTFECICEQISRLIKKSIKKWKIKTSLL